MPCLLRLQGIDFFFGKRAHATKFIDFLSGVVPIRYRHDKQLVSHNEQNASYNYKYTFSVEIVPICKVGLWAQLEQFEGRLISIYRGLGSLNSAMACLCCLC